MLTSQVIIKLILCNDVYHVYAQGFSGKVYHERFNSEAEARIFLQSLNQINIKLEKV